MERYITEENHLSSLRKHISKSFKEGATGLVIRRCLNDKTYILTETREVADDKHKLCIACGEKDA